MYHSTSYFNYFNFHGNLEIEYIAISNFQNHLEMEYIANVLVAINNSASWEGGSFWMKDIDTKITKKKFQPCQSSLKIPAYVILLPNRSTAQIHLPFTIDYKRLPYFCHCDRACVYSRVFHLTSAALWLKNWRNMLH